MIEFSKILDYVYENRLYESDVHGIEHWHQVEYNGLLLAPQTGADNIVVRLFALFHDSRRISDFHDKEHGPRAAEFASFCRKEKLFELDDERFEKLYKACSLHTAVLKTGDVTIDTCFDADRLDLGRVGIYPDEFRMATSAGKKITHSLALAKISVYHQREWIRNFQF